MTETELYHHGVKGQKWGVIRWRKNAKPRSRSLFRIKKKKKKILPQKPVVETKPKREDLSTISDEELRRRLNRLQMEKQYRDLTSQPAAKKEISAGKKFIKDVMYSAGKDVATQTAKYLMGTAVNKAFGAKVIKIKDSDKDKDKD